VLSFFVWRVHFGPPSLSHVIDRYPIPHPATLAPPTPCLMLQWRQKLRAQQFPCNACLRREKSSPTHTNNLSDPMTSCDRSAPLTRLPPCCPVFLSRHRQEGSYPPMSCPAYRSRCIQLNTRPTPGHSVPLLRKSSPHHCVSVLH
jgi:hypothetical protein